MLFAEFLLIQVLFFHNQPKNIAKRRKILIKIEVFFIFQFMILRVIIIPLCYTYKYLIQIIFNLKNDKRMLESGNWSETLIRRVGGSSKYQVLLFLNFSLKWVLAGMILFSLNFFYYTPEFKCSDSEVPAGQTCAQYVCSVEDEQFWLKHLEKPIPTSISLDYGVIMLCSKKWLSSVLQSLSYLGTFIGYLVMSYIADNQGRKRTQLISWLINIIGIIILVTSVNLYMVGIGSFLMGMGTNAAITLHYTFLKQLILGAFRQRSFIILQMMFSFGVSLVAFASMMISTWKIVAGFFILLPSILIIPFSVIIEETPNFSLKKGKQTLLKSMNKIAKINNEEELLNEDLDFIPEDAIEKKTNNEKYSFIDLFRYKSLRNFSIVCALLNMIIQFIYDGTILSLDKIGVSVYLDQILVGLVQIGAALFCSYIIVKVKRKKLTFVSLGLIALFTLLIGLLTLFYEHNENQLNLHTILEMVILGFLRFVLNSVWGAFFVYIAELFPSDVSSLSFGWISAMGTVGAVTAPFIRLLTADATMFFMSILSIVGILMVKGLKETKGKEIRQGIEERQLQRKKSVVSSGIEDEIKCQ